jgi:hypothetical protein
MRVNTAQECSPGMLIIIAGMATVGRGSGGTRMEGSFRMAGMGHVGESCGIDVIEE